MLVRERDTPEGLLVAICDRGCLGETYTDGEVSLTVTEEFYGGDPGDAEDVVDALTRASVANLVGERCVDVAIDAGLVDEENVLELEGTRHAQLLWL
jgi:hypothetical protein